MSLLQVMDNSIPKLIKKYKSEWGAPGAKRAFIEELKEKHIPDQFTLEGYLKSAEFFEKWLPHYFNLPQEPWNFRNKPNEDFSELITGTDNVTSLLGKEDTKLVYIVSPHNSQIDDPLIPIMLWASGLGDVLTFARSNVFRLKPIAKILRTGAFIGSFHEKMQRDMYIAANQAVQEWLEETALPRANVPKKEGTHKIYNNLQAFGTNGRSYDGFARPISAGISKRFIELQKKHPEWNIAFVPVVNSMQWAPEQDILPILKKYNLKKLTALYLALDYGTLIKKFIRQKKRNGVPKSDVRYDVLEPLYIKDFLPGEEENTRQSIIDMTQNLQTAFYNNYRITPEKLLCFVIAGEYKKQETIPIDSLQKSYDVKRSEMVKAGVKFMGPPKDILEKAVPFLEGHGAIKRDGDYITVRKPSCIQYQANTIAHLGPQ